MMRSLAVLAALAVLGCAVPATADMPDRPGNLEDCMAAAGGVTMEVDFCLGDEMERVEARLGPAYDQAMTLAEPGQKAALEQSQKDFLAYRQSWCEAKGGFEGSGHSSATAHCAIQLTEQRIKALEGFDGM
jgi:uncharacterized protein YecT (DUF1311 family)